MAELWKGVASRTCRITEEAIADLTRPGASALDREVVKDLAALLDRIVMRLGQGYEQRVDENGGIA